MSAKISGFLALAVGIWEPDLLVRAQGRVERAPTERLVGDVLELAEVRSGDPGTRRTYLPLCGTRAPTLSASDLHSCRPETTLERRSSMAVPFLDVDAAYRELEQPLDDAIRRVMDSGRFILGPEVESFERPLRRSRWARSTASVSRTAWRPWCSPWPPHGIGAGDEVIVPAATFVATWLAVTHVGATPVPGGVREATFTLDPAALERRHHAEDTRGGSGPPLRSPRRPRSDHRSLAADGLVVIDDAAQAHGARYRSRPIGGARIGHGLQLLPSKNLGAMGDGGAVTTDDDAIADRLRMLAKLRHARKVPERVRRLEQPARSPAGGDPGASSSPRSTSGTLAVGAWPRATTRPWLGGLAAAARTGRVGANTSTTSSWSACHAGAAFDAPPGGPSIETGIHYPIPPYRQPAFRHLGVAAERLREPRRRPRRVLSLPMGPHLTDEQQEQVIEAISSFDSGPLSLTTSAARRVVARDHLLGRRHDDPRIPHPAHDVPVDGLAHDPRGEVALEEVERRGAGATPASPIRAAQLRWEQRQESSARRPLGDLLERAVHELGASLQRQLEQDVDVLRAGTRRRRPAARANRPRHSSTARL